MTGSSASLQLWLPHLGQCLSKEREHGNIVLQSLAVKGNARMSEGMSSLQWSISTAVSSLLSPLYSNPF